MVTIQNLDFAYRNSGQLFVNLNLSLSNGHIYGLLGKNGKGKSTLLHLMSGLLYPKFDGIEILGFIPGKREATFLEEIYLLPEEFVVSDITPEKYAGLHASFYPHFNQDQFCRYLKELEVSADHSMMKMSMGQRKKALIAFALACNTRILMMDEPTNGLDIPSKTQFRRIIASNATDDRCIVISTHQVRDLENLIDTVVILEDNRIVFNESIDAIARRYNFVSYTDSDKPKQFLYNEPDIIGGKAIVPNRDGAPSRVDMEILFNAATSGDVKLDTLFNTKN